MPSKAYDSTPSESRVSSLKTIKKTKVDKRRKSIHNSNIEKRVGGPSEIELNGASSYLNDSAKTNHVAANSISMEECQSPTVDTQMNDSGDDNKSTSVWSYALKLSHDKAQCKKCERIISCEDHSTSGISKHLASCSNLNPIPQNSKKWHVSISPEEMRLYHQSAIEYIYSWTVEVLAT